MKPQDYINQLLKETDFSKIIEIRAKFQEEYPQEFTDYMINFAELNTRPWIRHCMTCKHWKDNRCVKNLKPIPVPRTTDRQEFHCSSWAKSSPE